jgi:hypothetical protein
MTQMNLGWHFCELRDGAPVLRDGTPLVIGKTYEHTGQLAMCESGYHDSERVIDALWYAPGPYLCRVLVSADLADHDKRVSRYRQAIAGIDATMILHDFATRIAYCALLHEREAGREPDARSWNAIAVKRAWMVGDATDADLTAARAAAMDGAARAAAMAAAAMAAARAAARAAAALDAALDAACGASEAMLLSLLPRELVLHDGDAR